MTHDEFMLGALSEARRGLEARRAVVAAELEREKARVEASRVEAAVLKANAADAARLENEVLGAADTELVPTLAEINAMAREGGLRPQGQSYAPSQERELRFERVAIQMPVDGSYKALVGFIERIEESKRFITVDQVSLRASEQGGGAGLAVSLSVYFRPGGRR